MNFFCIQRRFMIGQIDRRQASCFESGTFSDIITQEKVNVNLKNLDFFFLPFLIFYILAYSMNIFSNSIISEPLQSATLGWASLITQSVKSLPAMQETWVRFLASIPGLGRSPGEGNGNPLQYSCLENPMGRGAWWATVHEVTRVRHNLVLNHHHHMLQYVSQFIPFYWKIIFHYMDIPHFTYSFINHGNLGFF